MSTIKAPKGPKGGFPIYWVYIIIIAFFLFWQFFNTPEGPKQISRSDFQQKYLNKGVVEKVTVVKSAEDYSVEVFVNKDLIHFSNYDNERSLPSMVDGLKPS